MNHTESFTIAVTSEGRRIYVKRPVSQFASMPSYLRLFSEEAQAGLHWNNPHILRYLDAKEDADGPYITLEWLPNLTLHAALLEEPLGINNAQDSRQIMEQLFDAVGYLHAQGVLHLDLRPENILITRSAHDVKLINPASFYVGRIPSFVIFKERFSAPELFEEGCQPTAAADIYSLGRIMEYLYTYSHLSVGLSKVIARATDPHPAKRYRSVEEMAKAFAASRKTDRLTRMVKMTAAVCVVCFFYHMLSDNGTPAGIDPAIADSTQVARKPLPPSNRATDDDDPYSLPAYSQAASLADSIDGTIDGATRMPVKSAEAQALDDQTARLFKKEFRRRAEKVIAGIYTPTLINGNEKDFMKASTSGFTDLDRIQRELAEQYSMDPSLTTRLSSEVITELTKEYMNRIKHK